MAQPGPAVSSLLASLPELEASISAITERTWSDTEEELSSIDRAKLDVLAAYAINDLIWVYLKLQGVDPATHEVTKELDRIKGYYAKIRQVEDGPSKQPQIDKASAGRFIAASIPKAQRTNAKNDTSLPASSAAGLAALEARRAVEESVRRQLEEDDRGRGSMGSRFKFIPTDSQKVSEGQGWDEDEEEEDEDDDEEEQEANADSEEGAQTTTENFMKDFDDEMKRTDQDEEMK